MHVGMWGLAAIVIATVRRALRIGFSSLAAVARALSAVSAIDGTPLLTRAGG